MIVGDIGDVAVHQQVDDRASAGEGDRQRRKQEGRRVDAVQQRETSPGQG